MRRRLASWLCPVLAREACDYRHAFETTAADRDRLQMQLDRTAILLSTLPKSGSVFLWRAVHLSLGLPMCRVARRERATVEFLMNENLIEETLPLFRRAGGVAQHHLFPSPENIGLLREHGIDRIVVNVRDPRQAAVSWWHQVVRLGEFGADAPREDLAWEHYIVPAVRWIDGWLSASDLTIHFSSHEALAADSRACVAEILAFFGYPELTPVLPDRTAENHFRSGRTDEWRTFFSPAFLDKAAAAIPDTMRHRFGWL